MLPERIPAPENWAWQTASDLDLPDQARDILREMS
jgi:hypothetical protein